MAIRPPGQTLRFAFVSSNSIWGGSEELWSAAAAELAADGHQVTILMANIDWTQPRIRRLAELGCRFADLASLPLIPRRLLSLVARNFRPLPYGLKARMLRRALNRARPDLVIVSQGGNAEGRFLAARIRRMGLRYVLVSQKASDFYWPYDESLEELRSVYRDARCSYFVSEHNRRLTEQQIGLAIERSAVVRNPFLVPWDKEEGWPDEEGGYRLACVGRLFPREKGQDLVLRVMARDKWRARPISLTFFGSGVHEEALRGAASFLGLDKIGFGGFRAPADIWRGHHGLLLPSRAEGLPLVVVEAMLCGRVPIVTDVAGNREMVTDGETGFLAAAPTEDSVDEAMERAWRRRTEWRAIGDAAARDIRTRVPKDPARTFADLLLGLADPPA